MSLIDADAFVDKYCEHCGGHCGLDDCCCTTKERIMRIWGNPRFERLLVWAGFMKSPSMVSMGIEPTFKEAWTGVVKR